MPAPAVVPIVMMILEGLGIAASVGAVAAAVSTHSSGGSAEEIARAAARAHEAEGGSKINPRKLREVAQTATMQEAMGGALRAESTAQAAAQTARRKKWFGGEGRLSRYGMGGFNMAFMAAFLLPMLGEMFKGKEGGEGGLPELGMGGGGERDLLALMSALGGQGGGRMSPEDMKYMQGAQTMQERRNVFGAEPSSLGAGRADLDAIIQGNQELLGRISHNEPVSFAQAMAQHGLYNAMSQPRDMSQFVRYQ